MNNRVLLAALAGGVTSFLLGWLIWGILLMDVLREVNPQIEGMEKSPPNLVLIFVSGLVWALLYALIYNRWANISTFKTGLIAGAWISGLFAISLDLMFLATTNMVSVNGALIDVVANIVVGGLAGGVIGWVLGYGNRA
ncbi:MAG: hypothetical protein R3D58_12470 [Saprospiraceae bacterium]|nr:hypothetical protein [Lewinellaceae bacterium]